MFDLLARRPNLPRLIQHETLSGGARLSTELREWIQPIFARAHEVVRASPGARRWEPDQIPLLVLALYHIVVGYFAIAPLHRELEGEDLLTKRALARQIDFFDRLVTILLTKEGAGDPRIAAAEV